MKPWQRNLLLGAGTVAVMLGMVYGDVWLRARHAWQEGVKYEAWYRDPAQKKSALEAELAKEKAELESKKQKGKITPDEYVQRVEEADYDFQRQMEDNDIKYALVWYKTAVELFNPPRSRWVIQSEARIPDCKAQLWKDFVKAGVYTDDTPGREKFDLDW